MRNQGGALEIVLRSGVPVWLVKYENVPYLHFDSGYREKHSSHLKIFTSQSWLQSLMKIQRYWGGGG